MGLSNIDGKLLRKMIIAGANNLNRNRQIVDELNVFPVPDGDTGTNMSLTVLAAAREVECLESNNIYEVAKAASDGSLRGARGNSGVILSQLFRGFAKGLKNYEMADAYTIADAFKKGVETAYKAVMKPKEGTILTIAKEIASKSLQLADETEDLEVLLTESINHGNQVLNKTPEMLPVLKQAGVVDAGGKGLIFILSGAFEGINAPETITVDEAEQSTKVSYTALSQIDEKDIKFGYCTEFFINIKKVSNKVVNGFKDYLNSVGDSIIVVNSDELIKVHVHTDHPGSVLEKALSLGSLSNLKIDNMREQHTSKIDFETKKGKPKKTKSEKTQEKKDTAFIAMAMGKGIADIFKKLGVDAVIEGGQTMNPSTDDILKAIESLNADNIVILPNNKNIILAAEQASKLVKDKNVIVLNSKTIPQGISAMISYDSSKTIDSSVNSMKEAIKQVKTGQITFAVRDTTINDIKIKQGDILGMIESNIEVVCDNLDQASKQIIDKLIDNSSEIVSIYYGQDTNEADTNKLSDYISEKYPNCDIEIHNGKQPLYYFIISVE